MSIKVVRETHEAPESLERQLARAGGLNRFGEPNYRVVWGWSRLSWIGGKWTNFDSNGNITSERVELRMEPKYFPVDRWHIERWLSPEEYGSPKQWYAQTVEREDGIAIPALGPYPSRGDYEHCFTVETARGEFLPLTPAICEGLAAAVEWSRWQTNQARNAALAKREERSARDWETRADAVLDDATPAFNGQHFVTIAE